MKTITTMKQKLLTLLLMAFIPIVMMAYDCKVNGIYYNLNTSDKTASVTCDYDKNTNERPSYSAGSISIPASIKYNGTTYKVTSIGESAFEYCSSLTSITIPSSVTSIGDYAFSECSSLTSISIPSSVTSIGSRAFQYCRGLTSVTIPSSVTSIGSYAFNSCSGLTSITIPSSVTSIGSSAFSGCSGLTSVHISDLAAWCNISFGGKICNPLYYAHNLYLNGELVTNLVIPEGMTSIGDYTFDGCSCLTSITIPSSVTSIGTYAFGNCSGLTSVTIPEGVTSIGNYAFRNCSGLTSVTIPEGVTSIGNYAFESCTGLASITIPSSVTSIGTYAFNCSNLEYVEINNPNPIAISSSTFSNYANAALCVPNGSKSLYKSADYWKDFKFIISPSPVISFVDSFAKSKCVLYWDLNKDGELSEEEAACVTSLHVGTTNVFEENWTVYTSTSGYYLTSFNELKYFIGLKSISNYDFAGCCGLTSITIPSSVTSIGNYAFSGCYSLTSITIPEGVTSIGYLAFGSCRGLTSISVASGNTNYDSRNNCNAIIETSSNTLIVGCKNTVIPSSVTSIGSDAFSGCSSLTSITIPSSVTSIGSEAFFWCTGLTSITIPSSVTSIGYQAFYKCSSLTSITIPSSVTSISGGVFGNCSGLTSVTIPSSVTSIGSKAFSDCTSLTSITIPSSVTSIEDGAFKDCSNLTSVTVENPTPVTITSNVFSSRAKATLYVPYGSKAAYQAANYWKEFKEIIEYDNRPEQTLSLTEIPSKTYGDAAYSLPYNTIEGLTIIWTSSDTNVATISGNTLTITGAGTATITATQEGNNSYKPFSKEYILTVNKAPLTVIAKNSSMQYGDALPAFNAAYSGFKNGETASVLTTQPTFSTSGTSTSNVGSYNITVNGAESPNYEIEYVNGTLTITKAPLTIAAKSYTITQGDDLPTYEATYTGFKNNETASVLTNQPTFSCSATSNSSPGAYTITPSGATAANYDITYANGTLTIMGNQSIALSNLPSMTYGDAAYTLPETTAEGFMLTWTSSNTTVATISGNTLTITGAGSATITATQEGNNSYKPFTKEYTITVNKAPLTVTAENSNLQYGDALPTFEATYSGFKNGETASVLTTLPTFGTSATSTSPVGTYDITVSGAEAQNYEITYVNGTLTVTKAPLTVTANSYTMEQGDPIPTFEATYEGFKNGEDASVLATQPTFSCDATQDSEAGEYAITPSGAEAQNYEIAYASGTLTILPIDCYAVLSADGTTLTFYCDATKASRTGQYAPYGMNTGSSSPGWYTNRSGVTTVVFAPSFSKARPTTTSSWFRGMDHLTSVEGMENLNTSEVQDMRLMFQGCTSLAGIDLSHFNTEKVTNMRQMFQGCSSLTSLDLSAFDASNTAANDMNGMFYNCSALETLTLPATMSGLNTNACNGVGTADAPCQLVTPDGFDFGDTDPTGYSFQWKGGWFVQGSPVFGDVNRDEEVDVVDVVDIALFVAGTPADDFLVSRADINKDGSKNIADAVSLTNLIIGDTDFANGARFVRSAGTDRLALANNRDGFALGLANSRAYTAAQMDVTLDGDDAELEVALNADRRDGHRLLVNCTGDSTWRVVLFSTSNRELPGSSGELLHFDTKAGGITVSDIHFVAPDGTDYAFDDLSVATGIRGLDGDENDGDYYDLQGRKVKTPARGVYIQDGRKVVRK